MKSQKTKEREISGFRSYLIESEKSRSTIEKYTHDVEELLDFLGERPITKEELLDFKNAILKLYSANSLNTKLASVNAYLVYKGRPDLKVRYEKVQHKAFRDDSLDLTREEYFRLVDTAMKKNKVQLALILETMASTGMRISELCYITVESVYRGRVDVRLKGKNRIVLLPDRLCTAFKEYIEVKHLEEGALFISKNKKALNRSNIYVALKRLCKHANVDEKKVYPHNFRHFFALAYYRETGDLIHLSDILGHSSVNTTRIYTQCPIDAFRGEINKLNLIR